MYIFIYINTNLSLNTPCFGSVSRLSSLLFSSFLFASQSEREDSEQTTFCSSPPTGDNFQEMDHKETGCQVPPGAPKLCANNCGFFGNAATMNLCSKCHKDFVLKQEQAKLAASSIGSIVNAGPNECVALPVDLRIGSAESAPCITSSNTKAEVEEKAKEGPNRCTACKKRVGLTGFNCRCGNLFCSVHRYSDKHKCPYDYRGAAQDAISRANPVIRAYKLDKI